MSRLTWTWTSVPWTSRSPRPGSTVGVPPSGTPTRAPVQSRPRAIAGERGAGSRPGWAGLLYVRRRAGNSKKQGQCPHLFSHGCEARNIVIISGTVLRCARSRWAKFARNLCLPIHSRGGNHFIFWSDRPPTRDKIAIYSWQCARSELIVSIADGSAGSRPRAGGARRAIPDHTDRSAGRP